MNWEEKKEKTDNGCGEKWRLNLLQREILTLTYKEEILIYLLNLLLKYHHFIKKIFDVKSL